MVSSTSRVSEFSHTSVPVYSSTVVPMNAAIILFRIEHSAVIAQGGGGDYAVGFLAGIFWIYLPIFIACTRSILGVDL